MGTFTTNLKLGGKAFAVEGYANARVVELTVGQLRIQQTLPSCAQSAFGDPCYMEVAMCIETGVGSGTLWQFGKNIFANREDAEAGVVKMHQKYHKQRAALQERLATEAEQQKRADLEKLAQLKAKYESHGA